MQTEENEVTNETQTQQSQETEVFSLGTESANSSSQETTTVVENKKKKKEKPPKEPKKKLNAYERRKEKIKKYNDLLNLRGIPKFYTILVLEILYIFVTEIILKLLIGNFGWNYILLRIFLSSTILAVLITIISTNLPTKFRRGLLTVFNFFIAFYAWLQVGFMNFLGAFMSLGNASQGTKITDYIVDFIKAYDIEMYALFIPLIFTFIYFGVERYITRDGFIKKMKVSFITVLAMVVFIALLGFGYYITIEVDFMQNKLQSISNKELFKYPSNPSLAISNFGSTVYFILDVKGLILGGEEITYSSGNAGNNNDNTPTEPDLKRNIDDTAWNSLISIEEKKDYKVLHDYFINREVTDKNEYTGLFKGKNLIMIMMESVSEAVFHDEYKEYFPTLNKLYNEGITVTNNYSPRNNCATGDSEVTSQTSLYPVNTTCTASTYKNNTYNEALFYMLRNNGYYTSAYHDYTDQYYPRTTYEIKLGSYRYYGVADLGVNYNTAYKEWPSDVEFIEKALPKFIDQGKFASYMVTVTGHSPYAYSSKMGNKHLDLFKDLKVSDSVKRWLSKVKETDLAMEALLKGLEDAGKLEDTVIVLFGDHYPYALKTSEYKAVTPYDISVNSEVERTPFIIYNSATEAKKVDKYTTPMDYAPTILNLLGVDYDPRYYMGHDIFSDYVSYAVFPDDSWQSSFGYFNASKGEFYPTVGSTYNDQEVIAINNEISLMRKMSNLAIKKNYFNYLFKYFDDYRNLNSKDESTQSTNNVTKPSESTKTSTNQPTKNTENKKPTVDNSVENPVESPIEQPEDDNTNLDVSVDVEDETNTETEE